MFGRSDKGRRGPDFDEGYMKQLRTFIKGDLVTQEGVSLVTGPTPVAST